MSTKKLFIDTHDQARATFPAGLTAQQLAGFLAGYRDACTAEGVTIVEIYTSLSDGKAFCVTLADDADAVRRAHDRVGLPFDGITEVATASPNDAFWAVAAA